MTLSVSFSNFITPAFKILGNILNQPMSVLPLSVPPQHFSTEVLNTNACATITCGQGPGFLPLWGRRRLLHLPGFALFPTQITRWALVTSQGLVCAQMPSFWAELQVHGDWGMSPPRGDSTTRPTSCPSSPLQTSLHKKKGGGEE